MVRKVVALLAVAFVAAGLAFGHSKAEISRFVNDYVSASYDLEKAAKLFKKNRDSQEARRLAERANAKCASVQANLPYYADELEPYEKKIREATERIMQANGTIQAYAH